MREGKWMWEHDRSDVVYANWAQGQPDDYKGEDYGVIRAKTGEWCVYTSRGVTQRVYGI